jgi:hypothetical protein
MWLDCVCTSMPTYSMAGLHSRGLDRVDDVWGNRLPRLRGGQPLHPISFAWCVAFPARDQFTTLGAAPLHFNYPRDTLGLRGSSQRSRISSWS